MKISHNLFSINFFNIFLFRAFSFNTLVSTIFLSNLYFSTFVFRSITFNEHLLRKYKTMEEQILAVHYSQMYSELIYSTSRQLKYLVDKQGYLINRDDCSEMNIQNAVLLVIIFGVKINRCEHYLKVKMLIFRFYGLAKELHYNMNYISPLLFRLEIRKFRIILI